ncbi:histidine phosphatase family protein [Noviherbaspirillum sedimenti]|uniref:Phosphoglycerate mutase n=1 Tax=Noviherbaspirillum sedimenti TaxID=2320865 RepID=A0A3A3G4N9_9BURK|nr:histidine phosphatase family protein [Noviherbaspirillum sedimenti]RJG01472.1 phosphoglycerate mutase [Noviherbaspirillum sedimenti]
MRLYLIRHPQPLVAKGICYGSSDVAADPHDHARILQSLLLSLPKNARFFSSPLQRCAGLARDVADVLGNVTLSFDARLAEMDFGSWELRTWDDIPRAEIDAWASDTIHYRPGGGESVLQMAQRVRAFHDEVLMLQQDCVVICHAGTIRLLLACQRSLLPAEMALYAAQSSHQIAYGEVIHLEWQIP